MKVITEMRRAT